MKLFNYFKARDKAKEHKLHIWEGDSHYEDYGVVHASYAKDKYHIHMGTNLYPRACIEKYEGTLCMNKKLVTKLFSPSIILSTIKLTDGVVKPCFISSKIYLTGLRYNVGLLEAIDEDQIEDEWSGYKEVLAVAGELKLDEDELSYLALKYPEVYKYIIDKYKESDERFKGDE